jgi:hypothetical protein
MQINIFELPAILGLAGGFTELPVTAFGIIVELDILIKRG